MARGADDDNDNDEYDGQNGAESEMDVVNQEEGEMIDGEGDEEERVESQDGDDEEDAESATKNLRASYRLLEQDADGARHDIRSLEPTTLSRSLLKAQSLMKKGEWECRLHGKQPADRVLQCRECQKRRLMQGLLDSSPI